MDKHAGFPQMREVFFALCKSVGTPFALSAWLRFKYDHKSFLELDLDPADYEDAYSFSGDYLVASFLSKWKGLNTGLDLEAEALQRFRSSETSCRETNLRLKEFRNSGIKPRLETAIVSPREKLRGSLDLLIGLWCVTRMGGDRAQRLIFHAVVPLSTQN